MPRSLARSTCPLHVENGNFALSGRIPPETGDSLPKSRSVP